MQNNNRFERVAKVIANSGFCSRREAEEFIFEGKVAVNGLVINSPAMKVSTSDRLVVNGKDINKNVQLKTIIFNKPAEVIPSKVDDEGRTTIFELLPGRFEKFHLIGRLDFNSEGLIVITNSADLKRYMEMPENQIPRVYKVRVFGDLSENMLDKVKEGKIIEDELYKFDQVEIVKHSTNNNWLEITLLEGKNREIRKLLDAFDLKIDKLIRVAYGPFKLGKLEKSDFEDVSDMKEIYTMLGLKDRKKKSEDREKSEGRSFGGDRGRPARRDGDSEERPRRRSFGDRPERSERSDRPARPAREDRGERGERRSFGGDRGRPARRDGDSEERPRRRSFGDRPERSERSDRPARPAREDRGERRSFGGDRGRPARRDGDSEERPRRRSFGDRPERSERSDRPARPAREDRGERGERRSFGGDRGRPARRDGDSEERPRRRSFGDRPERSERSDRPARPAREDRGERGERRSFGGDRGRPARRDGDSEERPRRRSFGDRPERSDRPARPAREDRGERGERRSFGGDKKFNKPMSKRNENHSRKPKR